MKVSNDKTRTCKVCDKLLTPYQLLCCSRSCAAVNKDRNTVVMHKNCRYCGKPFDTKSVKRDACKTYCREQNKEKGTDEEYDRPYTHETRYLIRLWTRQGDSKTDIALMLKRSLKSIELAFN